MGGEFGRGEEEVVAAAQMGALVGEQGFAFGRFEGAEHAGGDDDAAGATGQRVGVRGGVAHHRELTGGGREAPAGGTHLAELTAGGTDEGEATEGEQAGGRAGGG